MSGTADDCTALRAQIERLRQRIQELESGVARGATAGSDAAQSQTDLAAANMALRQAAQRQQALLDALPDMVFRVTADGTFLDFSAQEGSTVLPPQRIVGANVDDLPFTPEARRLKNETMARALASGQTESFRYAFEMEDGQRHYEARMVRSGPEELVIIVRDVTEAHLAERQLKHRIELERLLANVSRRFIGCEAERIDIEIDNTLRELGEFSGADRSYVFQVADDGARFSNTHEWCADAIAPQIGLLQDLSLQDFAWAWEGLLRGTVFHVPSVADLPAQEHALRRILEIQSIRSLVIVPLNLGGRIAGSLGLDRVRMQQAWSQEDIRLLRTVADVIASALLRQRFEQALRSSEQIFFSVFASSPDIIGISRIDDATLLDVNPAFERILGFERQESLGHSAVELGVWAVPAERERLMAHVRSQGIAHNFETRFRCKTGGMIDVLVSASVVQIGDRECMLSTARDVTERRRAEEALRENEERFRQFAEHLPFLVWMVTPVPRRVVFVNAAYDAIFGRSASALLDDALDWQQAVHPDDLHLIPQVPDFTHMRGVFQVEFRIVRPEGAVRWLRNHVVALRNHADEVYLHAGITEDITESKLREQEVRKLNAVLESRVAQRTADLEASLRELESFSYSVSHDLRAPLRGINGFSHLLLEDYGSRLDADGHEYVRRICSATQRMGDLIDGLLTLARISRAELSARQIDLSALAQDVADELRQFEPGRAVEVAIAPDVAAQGDPILLRILLENLLGNAWKFTARADPACIEFGVRRHAGRDEFYVRDNGVGFDTAFIHKLFQPFERLHGVGEFPGSGIGLATVGRIAHRHGGRAWADSSPGVGATFYFTLG